jgi:hypothetical protein
VDAERRLFFERCLVLFGQLVLGRNQENSPLVRDALPYRLLQTIINDTELNTKYLGICSQAMALVAFVKLVWFE